MGRYVTIAIVLALAATAVWPGCASRNRPDDAAVRIVAGTYPMFLFTRAIVAGEPGVAVELMLDPNAGCPHDHQLTPADMIRLKSADVFVANGLGLDAAMHHAAQRANAKVTIIDGSAGVSNLLGDGGHQCSDPSHHHHDHGSHNPHLFADPRMAAEVVRSIARQLGQAYPTGQERFAANGERYAAELEKLADEFAEAGRRFANRKIVTQHDAFAYLARTARLEVVGVIRDEPNQPMSAAAKAALVRQVKSAGVAAIITEPQYSTRDAESIAAESGVSAKLVMLDPVATGPADPPADYYFTTMRKNLSALQDALGQQP